MSVDPFNDPDGRGKHPGDSDPIEIMVANFDAEIERLRDLLNKTSARNRTLARELRRAKLDT